MISTFKFFQKKVYIKNVYKDRCRLAIGSSFISRGRYCTVTRMWNDWFEASIQETGTRFNMKYENYLKTPSAAGRQLNRSYRAF
jgi:hypothetical protein